DYRHRWSQERAGHLRAEGQRTNGAAAPTSPQVRARGGDTDREFAEIIAGLGNGASTTGAARKRMLEILGGTGVMGATTTRLLAMLEVEGIAPARQSLDRWLEEEETAGRVQRASHGRWKAR
ncbi:MAG: hypothetical protein ACXWJJ_15275, partial [Ramlibacter sp.]